MAVVIRLRRGGMTHSPVYQIVVADKARARDGRFIEKLGTYFPKDEGEGALKINKERAEAWIKKGAKPSHRVRDLLKLNSSPTIP